MPVDAKVFFLCRNISLISINVITYGILRFGQLAGGGGLFGPDPENKVIVNRLI